MEPVEPIRTREDIRRMEDFLGRRSERNRMLFITGCNTALRISDLRRLRKQDVLGTHLVVRTKKTGKRVQLLINKRLRRELDAYTASMESGDYLFSSRKGWNKPLSRKGCYEVIKSAARGCGIERVGTHTMRKTFGYHFYQETKDIAQLQEIFGHQHPSVTLRYIGIIQDDMDQAMKGFEV